MDCSGVLYILVLTNFFKSVRYAILCVMYPFKDCQLATSIYMTRDEAAFQWSVIFLFNVCTDRDIPVVSGIPKHPFAASINGMG